tara:strand:+ start:7858 stop:8907 length:1050 start_codon:yes stop_codon:yes gene_type:complete
MTRILRLFLAFSIIPQIVTVKILSKNPQIVESYYSVKFYPYISKFLRSIFDNFTFSIGDILYIFTLTIIVFKVFKNRKMKIKKVIIDGLGILSVLYFIFHLFWGLNYYRTPLTQKLNLKTKYSTEDLIKTTKEIILLTNKVHFDITNDTEKVVSLKLNFEDLKKEINIGYKNISKKYPFLKYYPSNQKKSLFSTPLSYMGFSGYFNPFTNETQLNWHTPKNSQPITQAHEQAHQLGFAAENEANFIAFLATNENNNIFIKYSALTFALKHCLNDLFIKDLDSFNYLKSSVNYGVLKDFENRQKKWNYFKNPLEPLFKKIYSKFLNFNNQKLGIKSYSYVVAHIVNYYNR